MNIRAGLIAAAGLLSIMGAAHSQDYPQRTVTIIAPYGAGSPTEAEARRLGAHFEKTFKRSFIVENKPGAGASIGAAHVAKSAPDGHTLLYIGAAIASFKVLVKELSFDPHKDLVPVSLVMTLWSTFVVSSQSPFKTIEELVAHVKANPGKLNYGSAGRNTTMLKAEALLRAAGGLRMQEIPYPGEAQYLAALLRNDVQFSAGSLAGVRGQIEAGTMRPLLVMGDKRAPSLPNVPTTVEKGWHVPDNGWSGLFAPAGTPRAIVDRLAAEASRYVADPEVRKRGEAAGIEYIGLPTEQFRRRIESESKAWADTANALGVKPE